ncbi:MAG: MFS transporter [Pseudomonadales bacterium]
MNPAPVTSNRSLTFILLLGGTVLGLAGTDLVLPAIPNLPDSLSGSIEQAQLVLATYAAGSGIGLLLFGELGARFDHRRLLIASLGSFALLSALATLTESVLQLVAIRFLQGFSGAAAAVFAPGMIRKMFSEVGALRALGLMGSVESIVPALAPVLGAWLLLRFDWRASFVLIAVLAGALALVWVAVPKLLPSVQSTRSQQGYRTLMANPSFQRHALSQALSLGGLLAFVFGAPTVVTRVMGGSLSDFVIMQVIGISFYIVSANLAGRTVARFGAERMVLFGSIMCATGFGLIAVYALIDGSNPKMLWGLFLIANLGLGLRGPPGFYAAVVAAGDNDARGAALMLLYVLLTAALGTAAVAPFIEWGLLPLSGAALLITLGSVVTLRVIQEPESPSASE